MNVFGGIVTCFVKFSIHLEFSRESHRELTYLRGLRKYFKVGQKCFSGFRPFDEFKPENAKDS